MTVTTPLERRLIEDCQRGLPLVERPFLALARALDASEGQVLDALRSLLQRGIASRVGPVFAPNRAGASTLAAMAVPAERLDAVAELVNGYDEVNHNYEREHTLNLWFVVTGPHRERVGEVLDEIRDATGIEVLDLPMERGYHLDLGFRPW